jgi:predicted amidophosphoribosyltransferase
MPKKAKLCQSPQARWARKKKAAGACARCGEPRGKYKQLCNPCQAKQTQYMARYRAAKKAKETTNA